MILFKLFKRKRPCQATVDMIGGWIPIDCGERPVCMARSERGKWFYVCEKHSTLAKEIGHFPTPWTRFKRWLERRRDAA